MPAGGVLSDTYLGRYRTILYLSLVYVLGSSLMAITAIPGVTGTPPEAWGVTVSLLLVAIGTGGIKVRPLRRSPPPPPQRAVRSCGCAWRAHYS